MWSLAYITVFIFYLCATSISVSLDTTYCVHAANTSALLADCNAALASVPNTDRLVMVLRNSVKNRDAGTFGTQSHMHFHQIRDRKNNTDVRP